MAGLEGQSISEFEIVSKLGQGGMGTVYLARQSSLNRSVAIKVLPTHLAEDTTFVQRFHREATATANFSHPDIVQVFAAGEHNGVHFIAMEYVDGESLQKRISRDGRIAPADALAIAVRVAQALSYAWQKARLIHRDVKPSNILISNEGHVKLADLGMVKCLDDDTIQLTSSGVTLGTPYYVSPEQARGLKEIDFRADIYSLGCTLYHMLTGRVPYEGGGDSLAVILKQVSDPPPNILEVMPDCPPAIVTLLNKMLAKDRDHRQQSYDELIAEMFAAHDQIQQQPVSVPKPRSQRLAYAVAASAVIVVAIGILVWSPWKNISTGQPQVKVSGNTEQPPQTAAAALPHSDVAKTELAPQPAASSKPASDTPTSTNSQPFMTKSENSASPTSISPAAVEVSTLPAKSAATLASVTQPPPAVTASTNRGSAAMSPEEPHSTAATTASQATRNTDNPVRTAAEAEKNVHPATPAPAPNNESRVTDNETAFLKSVAALPPEQQVTRVMAKLKELNPQFDGKEQHKVENGAVTELTFSTVGVTDISPIKTLKWLKKLSIAPSRITQKGALSDLSPLAGLLLTGLWCQGNAISNLSPLKDMPLTTLSCGGTQIKDLTPLTGMKLTVLSFNDTEVSDLSPIQDMPLTVLWCNNTKVADLSFLKAMPLQELKCDFVAERDVTVLRNIKTLAKINDKPVATIWMRVGPMTAANPLTSVGTSTLPAIPANQLKQPNDTFVKEIPTLPPEEQVARVMAKLNSLNRGFAGDETHAIEDGKVTRLSITVTAGLSDISPLRALVNLRYFECIVSAAEFPLVDLRPLHSLSLVELKLRQVTVNDLKPLSGMPLETLNLDSCRIPNLSSLKGMQLKRLSLWSSTVSSLAPVAGMPLEWLNCTGTKVRDLSPLKGARLTQLFCDGTDVRDFSPLQDMPLRILRCDLKAAKQSAKALQSIKTLENINGMPAAVFWKNPKAL